jgi:hypothetical protein
MKALRVGICTVCLCALWAHAGRYALLVGNSTGGADEATLRYVENDLNAVRGVLIGLCGFDKNNVVTVYNGSPQDVDGAISSLTDRLALSGKDDMALFYYTGHADDRSLKLGDRLYDLSALKAKFAGFPAQIKIGIFDACQSGSFTRLKGGKLAEPFLFLSDSKVKGQVILSSSSSNESSQESDSYRNSVFTFHLINGLRGSADESGDGKVTLGEAYQYAYNHTVASTARSAEGAQHPGYQFSIQGEGEIVLADLSVHSSGVLLDQDVDGEITIIDEKGTIVADLHKEPNSATMIALNPGTYEITRHSASRTYSASCQVTEGSVCKTAAASFAEVVARKAQSKGSAEHSTHVDIAGSFAYEYMGLSSLSSDLNSRFAGYNMFGMYPDFWMPKGRFTGTGGVEVWIRDAIQLNFSLGYFAFDQEQDLSSVKVNAVDGRPYRYSLTCSDKVSAYTLYTGPGYKIREGILKNLAFHAGLNVYFITFNVASTFTDSLYDYVAPKNLTETGTMVVPSLGLSYRYPVLPCLDVGLMVRYRFQSSPGQVTSDAFGPVAVDNGAAEPVTFSYGLAGLDGRLFVCYRIGK